MLGFGTIVSPGAAAVQRHITFTCPEKGGLYINLGADVIFHRRMGFGFDAAWKASQGAYGGPAVSPSAPFFLISTAYTNRDSTKRSAQT